MGVRGLTKYISANSETYLQPHELCNTYVVVDGNNVAAHLYHWLSKSDSAFGGDYDEYYDIVVNFFSILCKCNLKPIVLLDGGHEKKKLKTLISRSVTHVPTLRKFAVRFSDAKFYPLFLREVFINAMMDMNIFCVRCDFEADSEIAAIARTLNCPVLSYDSDYFIYDVLYIPISTIQLKAVQYPNSKQHFIRCSIFSVTHLFKNFSGLDKSHLPILATVLGNDYNMNSLFQKFFGHVLLPKSRSMSYNQRRIHGVLHWLKKESAESATNLILTHVENRNASKVLQAIKSNTAAYTDISVSGAVLDKLTELLGNVRLKKKIFDLNLPEEIMQLHSQCRISMLLDIISLGIYLTGFQIENVLKQSSHFPALPLIRNIYTLLMPYMNAPGKLKLFLIIKNYYGAIKLENDPKNFLNHVFLHDILKEPKEERLKWLCSIVGIDDNDLNIVSTNEWSIFLMSYIYWVKKLKNSITLAHVNALVLMVISNEVVQKHVGYFRNFSKFMKHKKVLLNQKKKTEMTLGKPDSFDCLVNSVPLFEKVLIQGVLIPYRQTTEKGSGKAYDISVLHLFACFQSCLFHVQQLNALLNYPLPHCNVNNFYSGTLLFNFYLNAKAKPDFGEKLFQDFPNLAKLYTYLYENFCKFLGKVDIRVKKPRKKKKSKINVKNDASESETEEGISYEEDCSGFEYVDENNPYALLSDASF